MNTAKEMTPIERITEWAQRNQVTIEAEFVPFSKSRNAKEKHKSLNWRVTLLKAGHKVVTVDYSAGIAHCPSYKQGTLNCFDRDRIDFECAHGKMARGENFIMGGEPIFPDLCDVLHSLALDSDVLTYSGFEQWAREFGYDTDSRSAEKTYRACLEIALAMNQWIDLDELREVVSDY